MNLLAGRRSRRWLFAALYFCEGAPIGYLWFTMLEALGSMGYEEDAIGALTGALALVWALKFLWAPLVDVLRGPRWGFRAWIVCSQLWMALSLVPLMWFDDLVASGLLLLAVTAHALGAATQDVAIDGLAIRTTDPGERGKLNTFMQGGKFVGRGLFGGGGIWVREQWGDDAVATALVVVLATTLLLALFWREPEAQREERGTRARLGVFTEHLLAALRSRVTWLGLLFAATAGAAYEAVGGKATLLLRSEDVGTEVRSLFFSVGTLACMAVGAVLGGLLSDRRGDLPAARLTVMAAAASVALLAALVPVLDGDVLVVPLGLVYVAYGALIVAQYALLMDLTDPRLGATQFSAFMGATNLCESWSSVLVGIWIVEWGYSLAFSGMAVLSLVSLLVLRGFSADTRGTRA